MLQINQSFKLDPKVRNRGKNNQKVGLKVDLQQINPGFNQRERILDFGSKETLRNAKALRKSLQQVRGRKKSPRTNDGAKIHRSIGRGRSRERRKGHQNEQKIQLGDERKAQVYSQ